MHSRQWFISLGVGSLLLGGALVAAPLPGQAMQSTPAPNAALLEPAVGLIEAQEIALQEFPGTVVRSIELDRESSGLVYEVSLSGAEVDLDAMTGAVLRTEFDD